MKLFPLFANSNIPRTPVDHRLYVFERVTSKVWPLSTIEGIDSGV